MQSAEWIAQRRVLTRGYYQVSLCRVSELEVKIPLKTAFNLAGTMDTYGSHSSDRLSIVGNVS